MGYGSDAVETRTNADQGETNADFRVSFESRRLPDVRKLPRGGLWDIGRCSVYFIEGAGLIKIGASTDVDSRLRKMELACPVPLTFLGSCPGTLDHEAEWHKRFRHLRRHGEWFEDAADLREAIEAVVDPIWHRAQTTEGHPHP